MRILNWNHLSFLSCFLILFLSSLNLVVATFNDLLCPICNRVLRASKEYSSNGEKPSKSFLKYCSLSILSTEEQQFCYNSNGIQQEISRLLDYGADENRICKKIHKINPDFCSLKSSTWQDRSRMDRNSDVDSTDLRSENRKDEKTGDTVAPLSSAVEQQIVYPKKRGIIYE